MREQDFKFEHLLGVPFDHGKRDCYDIVQRFYRDNFQIELRDYARPDDWWSAGMNLYLDNFRDEGFEIVDVPAYQAQPADVFLVSVYAMSAGVSRPAVPNHAGIFLGPFHPKPMLHHYLNRRSEVVPMKGIWRNNLCAIIRHKDVKIDTEEASLDVMELLPKPMQEILKNAQPEES